MVDVYFNENFWFFSLFQRFYKQFVNMKQFLLICFQRLSKQIFYWFVDLLLLNGGLILRDDLTYLEPSLILPKILITSS